MAEFFHMGGHGFFVWSSYALVFGVLVYNFVSPIMRHKSLVRELSAAAKNEQRMQRKKA